MKNVQTWLNENYPQEQRANVQRILIVFTEPLEGHLDLRDFANLELLEFWEPGITSLDISQCPKLTRLFCPKNLFDLYSAQLEENAKVKFRQEFRSVGGRAATASNQVIDEWFNKFSFDRIYFANPLIVQPSFRPFPAGIDNLLDYLKYLPKDTEVAFGKGDQTDEMINILWHGFQVRNLPASLINQWESQTIQDVGELQRAFFRQDWNENLQQTNSISVNIIRNLQQQVGALQEELRQSRSELINQKIDIKKERLEIFMQQFEIDREKVRNLQSAYEQLVRFRRDYDQTEFNIARDNIDIIEQELLDRGISLENVKKVCHKCEKIAGLKWEISQINQQQFEARQGAAPPQIY